MPLNVDELISLTTNIITLSKCYNLAKTFNYLGLLQNDASIIISF